MSGFSPSRPRGTVPERERRDLLEAAVAATLATATGQAVGAEPLAAESPRSAHCQPRHAAPVSRLVRHRGNSVGLCGVEPDIELLSNL
jgi:hypothetical protein